MLVDARTAPQNRIALCNMHVVTFSYSHGTLCGDVLPHHFRDVRMEAWPSN
jgi:hypothetical protein